MTESSAAAAPDGKPTLRIRHWTSKRTPANPLKVEPKKTAPPAGASALVSLEVRRAIGTLKTHLNNLPEEAASLLLPTAIKAWGVIRNADAASYVQLLDLVKRSAGPIPANLIDEHARREQPSATNPAPGDLLSHSFWVRDAVLNKSLPYVVKGIVCKGQFLVFWGAPGSGKSFAVLEISCCVGSGAPWRGRRTRKGIVVYVAAESSRPYIENRIVALKNEWPAVTDAEVLVVPLALDLLHAERGDVDRVLEAARTLAKELGEVVLIVIDTLAVTFGGGNENAPEDMGMYVSNLKRIVAETGAAVLIVHHCGKDEARGMRGHSALLGALDAELAIEGSGGEDRILRTGKVRDGDGYTDLFAFRIRPVDLGTDPDGDPVRSCVVDGLDAGALARVRRGSKKLGKNQRAIVSTLAQRGPLTRPELVKVLVGEYGLTKGAAQHSITDLLTRDGIRNLHGVLTLE